MSSPLLTIPVGVVVERSKSASQWADYFWQPIAVLAGEPATTPWTRLAGNEDRVSFYAGRADVALHAAETTAYRDNIATGAPSLWVVLRPTETDPPYELYTVTADPSEGEAMTEAGGNIVEPVPMPAAIRAAIEAFIVEHHRERVFEKRKRDRADPEALARRERRGDRG
jgi:hypothetical protein